MTLTAVHVLGVVPAPLLAAAGRVHRLTIDAGGGAWRVRLLLGADLFTQQVVNRVQRAVVPPLVEVPPRGALGREVLGQVTPLTAGAEDVKDGVDDIPQISRAGTPARVNRQVRLD